MRIPEENLFPYLDKNQLIELKEDIGFENLKKENSKIINMGDQFFYPPKYLLNQLGYTIIFSENTMKRDIPSGSIWHYKNFEYKSEILRDDVGCGMALFLIEKGISKNDWISVLKNHSIGSGNHFINIGSYDKNKDYFLLHTDLNKEVRIPKNINEALRQISISKEKREELTDIIMKEIDARYILFDDWVHNDINIEEDRITYLKGIVDSKKNRQVGIVGLNPIEGVLMYLQPKEWLNGYMQHGLGVKNHDFKKEYIKVSNKLSYIDVESISNSSKAELIKRNYRSTDRFYEKYRGYALISKKQLIPKITFNIR